MKITTASFMRPLALLAFGLCLGMFAGCDKEKTNSPEEGGEKQGENLCKDYSTCDECIAGQQTKGKDLGTAETECGAAVLGCWTTWEKPITCGGKEMKGE